MGFPPAGGRVGEIVRLSSEGKRGIARGKHRLGAAGWDLRPGRIVWGKKPKRFTQITCVRPGLIPR